MWGVWGNSVHLVRLDKVTHVMQRAATGCRDWGRGDLDQTLRGVWAQVGSYWGDDGVEQSLVSVLSVSAIRERQEIERRTLISHHLISLMISLYPSLENGETNLMCILFIKLFPTCSSSVFMQFPQSVSFLEPKLSIYLVIITTKFPPPAE